MVDCEASATAFEDFNTGIDTKKRSHRDKCGSCRDLFMLVAGEIRAIDHVRMILVIDKLCVCKFRAQYSCFFR